MNIIVTAADEKYSDMLTKLIDSIHQIQKISTISIGVLDLGLSQTTLEKIKNKVTHIIQPKWDLEIGNELSKKSPHLRGITARPFLPEYFKGYELYLWLDADTQVQNGFAIDWLFAAASKGSIALIPENHQSYSNPISSIKWRTRRLRDYFGEDGLKSYWTNTYFNAGVFALKYDAVHWKVWAQYFRKGLENQRIEYVSDQTALNYAIWTEGLPVHPLPALCNWCCHLALPLLDKTTGKFFEPHVPHNEIGIIHKTANTKYCL